MPRAVRSGLSATLSNRFIGPFQYRRQPASPALLGRVRQTPPIADQHDADSERYRWRLARRTAGIAQAHELHQHISSARAIGRQLGVNHGTVRQWLKLTPPDAAT